MVAMLRGSGCIKCGDYAGATVREATHWVPVNAQGRHAVSVFEFCALAEVNHQNPVPSGVLDEALS